MSNRSFIGAAAVTHGAEAGIATGWLLRDLAIACHDQNQRWWHDPATGARLKRNLDEMLMLVVSEVAEALEGERKNLQDSHLPNRSAAEVELADVLIRVFDLAGANNVNLDREVALRVYQGQANEHEMPNLNCLAATAYHAIGGPANRAAGLLRIARACCAQVALLDTLLGDVVFQTLVYAGQHGYDLDGAVAEKRAYNETRADHTNAARLAANGKKF